MELDVLIWHMQSADDECEVDCFWSLSEAIAMTAMAEADIVHQSNDTTVQQTSCGPFVVSERM